MISLCLDLEACLLAVRMHFSHEYTSGCPGRGKDLLKKDAYHKWGGIAHRAGSQKEGKGSYIIIRTNRANKVVIQRLA